jgi:hypothetical protein
MNLKLVSLDCPSCGSALRGEGLDTIFFCEHCGDAATLGEHGLEMVQGSALVPAPGRHPALWKPAWLIEADVTVGDRLRSGGRESEGWSARRIFVVPAFVTSLSDLTRLARALSETAGTTAEVPREPIHGGTLAVDDAVTLIRHIVIGDEVRKSDMLASIRVDIEVVASRLVALPFEKTGDGLRCAVTGVTVRAES